MAQEETEETGTKYKIERVLRKYNLDRHIEDIPNMWLGIDTEEKSLREIAHMVNISVVEQFLKQSEEPTDGEANYILKVLQGSVDEASKENQKDRLRDKGLDPETLEEDLVSYSAVRRYLTNGVEVEKDTGQTPEEAIKSLEDNASRLETRTRKVLQNRLEQVNEKGILPISDPALIIDIQIYCRECNNQYNFHEFIEKGSCECGHPNAE